MMRREQREQQEQQSRVINELSALVFNLLRFPVSFSEEVPAVDRRRRRRRRMQITAGEFAALMLGVSMALMVCGTVTFLIGFVMIPWVVCLVMVLYVAGFVSVVSMLGRSLLCYALSPSSSSSPSPSPRKDIPAWKLL